MKRRGLLGWAELGLLGGITESVQTLAKFPPFSHSETHAPQLFITPTLPQGVCHVCFSCSTVLPARRMVSHSSAAVAPAVRASTPVQSKTRICISGFAKYSHNTGHSKKLADAVVKAYPQQYETWYHMASTELEVGGVHRAATKSPTLPTHH